jgi:hypothetical protein
MFFREYAAVGKGKALTLTTDKHQHKGCKQCRNSKPESVPQNV